MKKFITAFIIVSIFMISIFSISCSKEFVPNLNLDDVEKIWTDLGEKLTEQQEQEENIEDSITTYYANRGASSVDSLFVFAEDAIVLKRINLFSEQLIETVCGIVKCDSKRSAKMLYKYVKENFIDYYERELNYLEFINEKYYLDLTDERRYAFKEKIYDYKKLLDGYVAGMQGQYVWFGDVRYLQETLI